MSERRTPSPEFLELRDATLRLSDQVATLSLALQTVNALQVKQFEIERHQLEIEHMAVLATTAAEEQRDLSGVLLAQLGEIDVKVVAKEELAAYRRVMRRFSAITVSTAVVVVVLAIVWVNQHHNSAYQVCLDRDRGAQALNDFIRQDLTLTPKRPTPTQRSQAELLRQLQHANLVTDCSPLR